MPLPWQARHTVGWVPGRAPVPWQVSHAASDVVCMLTSEPASASAKSIVTSPSMSAPRRGPRVEVRLVVVPPKRLPKRSEMPESPAPPPRNRSSIDGPLPCPAPGNRNPPPPNRLRASSYSLRLAGSERIEFASEISLNRASAPALSAFWSGWNCRASLRNARLISSGLASLETPSTL